MKFFDIAAVTASAEKFQAFSKRELRRVIPYEGVRRKTLASGIDFLGWAHFLDYRVLRTATRKRMIKRLRTNPAAESINSYFGLLKHGNTYKLKLDIDNLFLSKN